MPIIVSRMTPEQIRERDAQWAAEAASARDRHERLIEAATGNPAAHAVTALHKPSLTHGAGECEGCDGQWGYDGEPPEWPCRTITTLEEVFDLTTS